MNSGSNDESLDYASVQGNLKFKEELKRLSIQVKIQEDNPFRASTRWCWRLSNAFPELINDGEVGADFDIRNIDTEEKGMALMSCKMNLKKDTYWRLINNR